MESKTLLDYLPFPELQVDESVEYPVRTVDSEKWVRKTKVIRALSSGFQNLDPDEARRLYELDDLFNQIIAADRPKELPSLESIKDGREALISLAKKIFIRGSFRGDPFGKLAQKVGIIWSELNRVEFDHVSMSPAEDSFFVKNLARYKVRLSYEVENVFESDSVLETSREEIKELMETARNEMERGGYNTNFFDSFKPIPAEALEE